MYTIVYSFIVKPGKEDDFETSWLNVTKELYKNHGSLGSRLHKPTDTSYLAYAQWPNKEVFDVSSNAEKSPALLKSLENMKDCCYTIDTLHKLEVAIDFLQSNPFN
ncbi:hypothetical protein NBRC110019_21110 [Neptunitalea chrysea]|uniref:ABM domain-containing protein n=1 Tax=Neptunitalea chrysea TaxID=1647581 RepID=A0A9W6B5B2_9FLAO|nr:antibiotic biosynthesis monooxygenase [Neptunitalea chrysea]GLB53071.1 hypothetical protein NBRC110019_21110 [Neptunitalea chrysea]